MSFAPKLFMAVGDALTWALYQRGIKYLLQYLDDFLFLGSPHTEEAAMAMQLALHIFNHVGVLVAAEKTEGPSTCITFLGIVIDTVSYQLQLPEEKVAGCYPWCSTGSLGSPVLAQSLSPFWDTLHMPRLSYSKGGHSCANCLQCYQC